MKVLFTEESWEDYLFWQQADSRILNRINTFLKDISRHPFTGIGKPEPLRFNYKGYWSRRITEEHRLIYDVREEKIIIAKCRFHYDP